MRQHGSNTGGLKGRSMQRPLILLITGCIVLGLFVGSACTSGGATQPQENPGGKSEETTAPAGITPPVSPPPPVEPLPPPSIPATPDPANQPPPDSNSPTGDSPDATALITRQASQMTLTLKDMGPGWTQGSAIAPSIQQVTSSSHVYYTQGSSYAPGVQNTVAVYRSIAFAENAYTKEKQANPSVSNPAIGDECLLNDSVPINKVLIFRKNNIVVWLWVKQYKEGDIERYARIVEQRINTVASPPVLPGQSSQTPSTPSQQTPAELSMIPQPVIAKPASGLITKQAYEMVLTKEDMGPGWIKGNVSLPSNRGSTSSSYVYYSQGSSFAPGVQNTVAVYRDLNAAGKVYADAKPSNVSLLYPGIGDECFLNDAVAINRLLVFRKGNVVVWIWLQQYKTGDIEGYARIVEKKITF
jgi:hypothetical protein